MKTYEKHEAVAVVEADPLPDPVQMMRESVAQLDEPAPPIDSYPSTLAVRRSRLIEDGVELVARAEPSAEEEAESGPENTNDNPKSWIAWKRRAEAAEAALQKLKI